ncbi:MAG: hypothetical protein HQL31_00725 [Planctomycetes bacterium]|nr:hypothetical protein [Planctomycetota bacterium]
MKNHLYLSLIPESLIASQLPPEEFGSYYAVGTKKRSRGQAIFFEVDFFESDYFPMSEITKRCVPHPDGSPKHSIYLSVYRALEHVPLTALKSLYLVTDDGRVLGLDRADFKQHRTHEHHMYQEYCPATSRVVSSLDPLDFCKSMTNPQNPVSMPRIVFADLILDKLSRDPDSTDVDNLPYHNIGHLRDCLRELEAQGSKSNKQVNRGINHEILYRTIRNGFFVGGFDEMLYYPLPPKERLEREYYEWWRSALTTFGQ